MFIIITGRLLAENF